MSDMDSAGDTKPSSEVQRFYSGRHVLLTGATGFCGKVLLEKMLRSCPELERVYVLVRPRHGQKVVDRVTSLLNQPIFSQVSPESRGKVVAVCGDMSRPGLGLSLGDMEEICRRVSVVFHVAASVRFDDDLRTAVLANVSATEAVVKLASSMDHLQALVYVSTAYSNCPQGRVDEKVYEQLIGPGQLYGRLRSASEEDVARLETSILSEWPNTYTFTKALAEAVVQEAGDTLPVAIFRPSIVACTWREPVPGWLDSMNGPTLSIMGSALGKMRCGVMRMGSTADLVPVDMVASALIASAWDTARCSDRKTSRVYNFVSGPRNPITWEQFYEYARECNWAYPSANAVWYCSPIFTPYKKLYLLLSFVLELVPTLLLDLLPYLSTGKHRNLDTYLKARRFLNLVSYFATRQWTFSDDNVVAMLARMSPEDKALFPMDVADIKWRDFTWTYVKGVRQHMLKESPSSVPAARRRYYRLYLLHQVVRLVLYGLLCACAFRLLWHRV